MLGGPVLLRVAEHLLGRRVERLAENLHGEVGDTPDEVVSELVHRVGTQVVRIVGEGVQPGRRKPVEEVAAAHEDDNERSDPEGGQRVQHEDHQG